MKLFKIFIAAVCIVCMPCAFFGCSNNGNVADSGYIYQADQITTETSVWLSYSVFDGTKQYDIDIEQPRKLFVKTLTRGGAINLKVELGESVIYQGDITDKSEGFTVELKKAGTYKAVITGDNHDGEVKLSWKE